MSGRFPRGVVETPLKLVRAGWATWADVVEETLRPEPAVRHIPLRNAVRDITLPHGRSARANRSMRRSPRWNRRAEGAPTQAFDVSRTAEEHLAFGDGVHWCLGAPAPSARLEASRLMWRGATPIPSPAAGAVKGLIALYNEAVDIIVDRERLERPTTGFTRRPAG